MYIAAFDIGSTEAKGLLVDGDGRAVQSASQTYATSTLHGLVEQAPADWWQAVCQMLQTFWASGIDSSTVCAVVLTGQMQDVIATNDTGVPVRPAILYSDARAAVEAQFAAEVLTQQGVDACQFPHLDATAPLAKWLWLLRHEPDRSREIRHLLFSAKDYIVYRLTGEAATDTTTAGTTSLFDATQLDWQSNWMDRLDLDSAWLPRVYDAWSVCGHVSEQAADVTGLRAGTPVLAGCGDAAATTMAAGVTSPGDTYIYLGTTGWAATLSSHFVPEQHGHFSLPYPIGDTFVDIAPVLNAGTAHLWIAQLIEGSARKTGCPVDYQGLDRLLADTPTYSDGVIFLPYLNGERCPVQDHRALGTFLFLSPNTCHGQLAWAVLEGISYSIRQVLDTMPPIPQSAPIRAIGGMTRSSIFCQLLADVLRRDVHIVKGAVHASGLAAAALATPSLGWFQTVGAAVTAWFRAADNTDEVFSPRPDRASTCAAGYETYLRVYPAVSEI